MSKADQRHEVKKILETKSNILEKASRRASALNMTRLCPTLVLATGSSTLRSVRLQELNVTFVILATTAEEAEVRGGSSATPPTLLEGVANKSILLDENKDNEEQIELYFHNAADWIHELKVGVAMVHAPEGGAFKKGASLTDSRRGEGFAAALCAVSCIAVISIIYCQWQDIHLVDKIWNSNLNLNFWVSKTTELITSSFHEIFSKFLTSGMVLMKKLQQYINKQDWFDTITSKSRLTQKIAQKPMLYLA